MLKNSVTGFTMTAKSALCKNFTCCEDKIQKAMDQVNILLRQLDDVAIRLQRLDANNQLPVAFRVNLETRKETLTSVVFMYEMYAQKQIEKLSEILTEMKGHYQEPEAGNISPIS